MEKLERLTSDFLTKLPFALEGELATMLEEIRLQKLKENLPLLIVKNNLFEPFIEQSGAIGYASKTSELVLMATPFWENSDNYMPVEIDGELVDEILVTTKTLYIRKWYKKEVKKLIKYYLENEITDDY